MYEVEKSYDKDVGAVVESDVEKKQAVEVLVACEEEVAPQVQLFASYDRAHLCTL